MKVVHKNSKEEFDLSKPCYTKLSGLYGWLVRGNTEIFFISDFDSFEYVTEDFEILTTC